MNIHYRNDAPQFDGANLLMHFVAEVDGELLDCAITAEALEDHFGAESALEGPLQDAYARGRARIRTVCSEAIEQTGGSVVLHSGRFRMSD
ncbi:MULTISPECIES: DUF1488 domain-containing protein [Paraburkholderia]|uniref:Uncharacterized protein DUF1488 n=1 Tax=Paraburkholderia tropica TaxID=92647 RepID=A0A1A5X175_9BURK|nr:MULTISPECIES: DUF1488 domain-containing protein [Paraburkholderia]MBB2978938.1 hypothetical protein [Paraburkholderia tropica]MBB2999231.1 hypothetical protein [Paraburkholderia tropica]MBB6318869.1 hypothetical protein [Paraburkholderia tropica]MDE1138958.1 DUF1488 domain-containing protein [Paraburkholderia tropica]OBR47074.1 transcriptional regulator [Paraburkholderia tropica]